MPDLTLTDLKWLEIQMHCRMMARSEETRRAIDAELTKWFAALGIKLDATVYCSCGGTLEHDPDCDKPNLVLPIPEMAEADLDGLLAEHGIDPNQLKGVLDRLLQQRGRTS